MKSSEQLDDMVKNMSTVVRPQVGMQEWNKGLVTMLKNWNAIMPYILNSHSSER